MSRPQRLILDDAKDALCRKVLRAEIDLDGFVVIDLPKRYAQTGATKFTEASSKRRLDRDGIRYLLAWLQDALPHVTDHD